MNFHFFSRNIAISGRFSNFFTIGWDQFHTENFLGGTSKKTHPVVSISSRSLHHHPLTLFSDNDDGNDDGGAGVDNDYDDSDIMLVVRS